MRKIFILLVFLLVPFAAFGQLSNINSDVTKLSKEVSGFNVEVKLTTRLVNSTEIIFAGEPGQFPQKFRVVRNMEITVNKKPIVVPYNAYADLIWIETAELKISEKQGTLIVTGGDASESYFVNISFDSEAVRTRTDYTSLVPNEPVQETHYFLQVIE